jgi:hypothetical protein
MFVGLQGWAVSAKATAAPHIKTKTGDIRTRQLIEPPDRSQTAYFNGQNEQHAHQIRYRSLHQLDPRQNLMSRPIRGRSLDSEKRLRIA